MTKLPPEPPEIRINPGDLQDVSCKNCGNQTFQKVAVLKRLSPIVAPSGKEEMIPIPVWACNACGGINPEFLKGIPFGKTKEDSLVSPSVNEAPAPTPPSTETKPSNPLLFT